MVGKEFDLENLTLGARIPGFDVHTDCELAIAVVHFRLTVRSIMAHGGLRKLSHVVLSICIKAFRPESKLYEQYRGEGRL